MATKDHWLASTARHQFSALIDAAVAGRPQTVRRRDGREVVVVSREYFEANSPNLKSILLNFKFKHQDDGELLHAALAEGGRLLSSAFTPASEGEEIVDADDARHKRRERSEGGEDSAT